MTSLRGTFFERARAWQSSNSGAKPFPVTLMRTGPWGVETSMNSRGRVRRSALEMRRPRVVVSRRMRLERASLSSCFATTVRT